MDPARRPVDPAPRPVDPARRPVDPAGLRFAVVGGAGSLRPGAARAAVAAGHLGVPVVRREDVQLAVHECLANALEHGHGRDGSRPIDVEVARGEHATVTVRITDHGPGGGASAVADPDRGRGRALVRALTDGVMARSSGGGTEVMLWWGTTSGGSAGLPGALQAGHGPREWTMAGDPEVDPWHD